MTSGTLSPISFTIIPVATPKDCREGEDDSDESFGTAARGSLGEGSNLEQLIHMTTTDSADDGKAENTLFRARTSHLSPTAALRAENERAQAEEYTSCAALPPLPQPP